jgi:Na+/alanine symporter
LPSAIQAIYPNPATDQLTVVLNTLVDELVVSDATGRIVMRTRVNGQRNVVLTIDALAQGTYFIATPSGAVRFVKH